LGEKLGILPSREWKMAQKNRVWYPGDTLITGIGQGYHQVTPLQLARATATLANRGNIVTPFLVDHLVTAKETRLGPESHKGVIPLKSANLNSVIEGMVNVVHSQHGTAKSVGKNLDYQIAGKTGTAQVMGIKQNARYNENEIDFKYRDHALFIAFAPVDNPKIAVAVIAENGGHGGSVAAPIAGAVIKQYLQGQP
jgi:penicillin-binding protein 2